MKITLEIETTDIEQITEAVNFLTTLALKDVTDIAKIQTETGVEDTNPPKQDEIPTEDKKVRKRAPRAKKEKVVEEAKEETGITLTALKDRAKEKAQSAGRDKVKECISEFAPKLSEVNEADYGKLYKKLGAM